MYRERGNKGESKQNCYLCVPVHVPDAHEPGHVVPVHLRDILGREHGAGELLPHRLSQVQAERGSGPDSDTHQHTQEPGQNKYQ